MTQLYHESVVEISLDEDINLSFVLDSEPSKGNTLNMLLQVVNLPEEPMKNEMLSNLQPQFILIEN